eukprot:5010162-Alexandrium_andersonii.AAC.1
MLPEADFNRVGMKLSRGIQISTHFSGIGCSETAIGYLSQVFKAKTSENGKMPFWCIGRKFIGPSVYCATDNNKVCRQFLQAHDPEAALKPAHVFNEDIMARIDQSTHDKLQALLDEGRRLDAESPRKGVSDDVFRQRRDDLGMDMLLKMKD